MTKKPELTIEIAHAAGEDAANRRMRKEGRTTWNEDDLGVAADVSNRLSLTIPYERGGLQGLCEEVLRHDYPSLFRHTGPPSG